MKKLIIFLIVLFWVAMTALLIGLDRKGVRMLKKTFRGVSPERYCWFHGFSQPFAG